MLVAMTKPSSRLTDPSLVALRLRQHMGGEKITRRQVVQLTGINRTSLGLKLDGKLPFTYDEMDLVLAALNLSWIWLVTGSDADHPSYPFSSAGDQRDLPSHQARPFHYKSSVRGSNAQLSFGSRLSCRPVQIQQTLANPQVERAQDVASARTYGSQVRQVVSAGL